MTGKKLTTATKKGRVIETVQKIIKEYETRLTLRQIFYRLVAREIIENNRAQYNQLSEYLVFARKEGYISWDDIEDRTRESVGRDTYYIDPNIYLENSVNKYENAEQTLKDSYNQFELPRWYKQPVYLEIWLEKEALSGLFKTVTDPNNVTLTTVRGFSSWTLLHDTAQRLKEIDKDIVILYFGDHDPSGLSIDQFIQDALNYFGITFHFIRVAMTLEQIKEHNIPTQTVKPGDTRSKKYIEKYGNMAVELDAIEPPDLTDLIQNSINVFFEEDIYQEVKEEENSLKENMINQIDEYLQNQ